ncbi:MAG: FkbM family methyltransferase [Hyphomicrobium sp.]
MCHGYFFHGGLLHENGTHKVLERFVTPGSVFVDVGANVGYFSLMAARLCGPQGKVIAIEPSPAAVRLLRLNLDNVAHAEIVEKAAGDSHGAVRFFVRKNGDMSSLEYEHGLQSVLVEIDALDQLLAGQERIDFIKIDVEGFERDVLSGASRVIAKHRPIIYFEFIEQFAQRLGFGLEDFKRQLQPLNYTLLWANNDPTERVCFGAVPSTYVAAMPNERLGDVAVIAATP